MADPQTRRFVGGPWDGQDRKITTDTCTAHGHGEPVVYRLVDEKMVTGGPARTTAPTGIERLAADLKPIAKAFPDAEKPKRKPAKKAAAKGGDDEAG